MGGGELGNNGHIFQTKKKKGYIQLTYLSTVFLGTIGRILKLEFVVKSIPCTDHNYRVGQRDQRPEQ